MDNKDYKTIYVKASRGEEDAKNIEQAIRVWTDAGAGLHSVIPRVESGETVGYILLIDKTNIE